jgi:hypothetical protein
MMIVRKNTTIVLVLIVFFSILLSACSVSNMDKVEIAVDNCPELENYSPKELIQAAKELNSLPSESQVTNMMNDYSKLREACRFAKRKMKNRR